MRDYTNFDFYLNKLQGDIYPQPPDPLQQEYGDWVIDNWVSQIFGCKTVLDVGCGQAQFKQSFERHKISWAGVTLGPDYLYCLEHNIQPVHKLDFSFMEEFDNATFDLVFARHVLEHSPFPLLTLMEWNRVSKQSVCVILPNPDTVQDRGKNHYSVMSAVQFTWLANRAGLHVIWENSNKFEMRFMLQKGQEVKE